MPSDYPFRIPFESGLKPKAEAQLAEQGFFTDLTNLRVTDYGFGRPNTIVFPVSSFTSAVSWPFPHFLKGGTKTLLCYGTALYTVAESTWAATYITPYDVSDTDDHAALTKDDQWQGAFFQEYYFLTNGTDFVWLAPSNTSDKVLAANTTFKCEAVAEFEDRLFLGGVSGSWFTDGGNSWDDYFAAWRASCEERSMTYDDQTIGTNWIIWSSRLGGDRDWPYADILSFLGLPDSTTADKIKEAVLEQVENRFIGMCPLPSQGTVKRMMPLGNSLIIYTDEDVWSVARAEGYYFPVRISEVGVASRNAVTGDRNEHFFLTTNWELIHLTSQGMEVLGYEEFMDDLTLASVVCSFDVRDREAYIADGSSGFLFTRKGLSKITVMPTSLLRSQYAESTSGEKLMGPCAYGDDFTLGTEQIINGTLATSTNWHNQSPWVHGDSLDPKEYSGMWHRPRATGSNNQVYQNNLLMSYSEGDLLLIEYQLIMPDTSMGTYVISDLTDYPEGDSSRRDIPGIVRELVAPPKIGNAVPRKLGFRVDTDGCTCSDIAIDNISLKEVTAGTVTVGSEMLTNGSFASSASGWSLGTGWAYSSSEQAVVGTNASGEFKQTISALVDSTLYCIVLDIEVTSGYVDMYLGDDWDTWVSEIDTTGTYTYYLYADYTTDGDLVFDPSSFTGQINSVSVKAVTVVDLSDGAFGRDPINGAEVTADGTSIYNGDFVIETGVTDLGQRGLKQLSFVELQGRGLTNVAVMTRFRYENDDSLTDGEWVYADPKGIAYSGIAAMEYAFKIRGTLASTGKLEKLVARYRPADNRSVRGPRG